MNYYDPGLTPLENEPRKKKKHPAVLLAVLAVILLALAAGGGLIYKNVFIGQPSTDVTLSSAVLTDQHLELRGSFNGFAGLKGYTYTVEEDIVVLELSSAWPLLGAAREFAIVIEDDFSAVSEINLSDGLVSMVVWDANDPYDPDTAND